MKKKIILVLEDEKPLQEAIIFKLKKNDFEVVSAQTVKQALDYMEEIKNICVMWVDHYVLGKEDGLYFVSRVKTNKKWKSIPIFVVSNTASPDKVHSYLSLGVEKYFVKSEKKLDEIILDIKKEIV